MYKTVKSNEHNLCKLTWKLVTKNIWNAKICGTQVTWSTRDQFRFTSYLYYNSKYKSNSAWNSNDIKHMKTRTFFTRTTPDGIKPGVMFVFAMKWWSSSKSSSNLLLSWLSVVLSFASRDLASISGAVTGLILQWSQLFHCPLRISNFQHVNLHLNCQSSVWMSGKI